jgi:hypothetical protein
MGSGTGSSSGSGSGSDFERVPASISQRVGLLSQGSILAMTSGVNYSKPTGRGYFILNQITCTPPPPFPDNAGITPISNNDPNLTIREKLAVHRQNVSCAGCHAQMDPIGLSLENFDQLGRWRTSYPENGKAVDATGTLYGRGFNDYRDLTQSILEQGTYGTCFTRKILSYSSGRNLVSGDQCAIKAVASAKINTDATFVDFVASVVYSKSFLDQ